MNIFIPTWFITVLKIIFCMAGLGLAFLGVIFILVFKDSKIRL